MEAAEGEFAQLMALFAAWRADIDSEPFAYSDEDLLATAEWPRDEQPADPYPPPSPDPQPEPPADASPHWM